jgi:probable HAF family extracellular repeat protein
MPLVLRRTMISLSVLFFFVLPLKAQTRRPAHHRYHLIEIGTFGGPNSVYNVDSVIVRSADGAFVGAANTAQPDPFTSNCFDSVTCFVQHAYEWRNGRLFDLGVLPGGLSSYTNAINMQGLVIGQSQNGATDLDTGVPAYVATVWKDGHPNGLGTFGGSFSLATAVNDFGLVTGAAENGVQDPFQFALNSGLGGTTELRGFVWDGGRLRDIGTLGGSAAFPLAINNAGQIVGLSLATLDAGPTGFPVIAPFLWANGKIINLGTLGGTSGAAVAINKRGQVAGGSDLSGDDISHAFLWSHGKMKDLGALEDGSAGANWLNDTGQVIGISTVEDFTAFHGFLWSEGKLLDLGTVTGDNNSNAFGINDSGQVVGQSWTFDGDTTTASHAFLWESGEMVDLNELVSNHTNLVLTEASYIDVNGEIIARGLLPNGDVHTVVLVPETTLCFPPFSPGPSRKHGPLPRKTFAAWRHNQLLHGKLSPPPH